MQYWTFILLTVVLIGCSLESERSCDLVFDEASDPYAVKISETFAYYPLHYAERSFVDSIDSKVEGLRFSGQRPNIPSSFTSCEDAVEKAANHFAAGKPSLIQFNGIMGKFPYENELYASILGLHIENTGCYYSDFDTCYNHEMWRLLDDWYKADMRLVLKSLDTLYNRLVIDHDAEQAVITSTMPSLLKVDPDQPIGLMRDTIFCRSENWMVGRFEVLVNANGTAEVLRYREGTLDCNCIEQMTSYFEGVRWNPAVANGAKINAIVEFQFMY